MRLIWKQLHSAISSLKEVIMSCYRNTYNHNDLDINHHNRYNVKIKMGLISTSAALIQVVSQKYGIYHLGMTLILCNGPVLCHCPKHSSPECIYPEIEINPASLTWLLTLSIQVKPQGGISLDKHNRSTDIRCSNNVDSNQFSILP